MPVTEDKAAAQKVSLGRTFWQKLVLKEEKPSPLSANVP